MKKRLTGKKAGIVILAVLFIISIADVILRATVFSDIASTAANYGEVLITAALSALLIVFALKGKDRVFYILCGAFLSYFVLNQLFALPEGLSLQFFMLNEGNWVLNLGDVGGFLSIASMICIIVIGGLLVEYMNDGSIYNRAFNGFCVATVLMLTAAIMIHIHGILTVTGASFLLLNMFNNLQRICMVFLFTCFAYDSAKKQLAKTKL